MGRTYYVHGAKGYVSADKGTADFVMLDRKELEDLERKLKNKTEEAARLAKKLSGEDREYKLVLVDYLREISPPSTQYIKGAGQITVGGSETVRVFVTVSLPVPAEPSAKNQAKSLVESVFERYIKNKKFKLHWAPKAGWSVNLEMNEADFDTFQLPKS